MLKLFFKSNKHDSRPEFSVVLVDFCMLINDLYFIFIVGNISVFFRCSEVKKRWRAVELEEVSVELMTCANPLDTMRKVIHMPLDAKLSTVCLPSMVLVVRRNKRNKKRECHLTVDELSQFTAE